LDKILNMENHQIVLELGKGFAVLFFLAVFYIGIKKASVIAKSFEELLKKNGFELNKEYRKKLLRRVIKKQISFKPFNQIELEAYLIFEVFDSSDFKKNLIESKDLAK